MAELFRVMLPKEKSRGHLCMLPGGPLDSGRTMDSEYEAQRARNIARNAEELDRLGLQKLIEKRPSVPRQPRQRKAPREPTRESRRTRSLPTPAYTPGMHEAMAAEARTVAVDEGRRLPDGSWSGERFGAVAGVKVGHVFGAGDYQRLGRQEMMDSGFFRPFVTPEWNAPGEGCYAVILNNDNGASTDEGDRIFYAGSGGRRRVGPQWLDTKHICVSLPTVHGDLTRTCVSMGQQARAEPHGPAELRSGLAEPHERGAPPEQRDGRAGACRPGPQAAGRPRHRRVRWGVPVRRALHSRESGARTVAQHEVQDGDVHSGPSTLAEVSPPSHMLLGHSFFLSERIQPPSITIFRVSKVSATKRDF